MLTETRTITINDEGLEPWLREIVRNLALVFPQIIRIILFGSYATGKIHKFSDVDLAFEMDSTADHVIWRKLTDMVNASDKLAKIDCVNLAHARPALKKIIDKEGSELYVR